MTGASMKESLIFDNIFDIFIVSIGHIVLISITIDGFLVECTLSRFCQRIAFHIFSSEQQD